MTSRLSKYIGAVLAAAVFALSTFAQAQPSKSVMWRDTVRACELAGIDDNSSLSQVLEALKTKFGPEGLGILSFPANPAKPILKRIVVTANDGTHVEWEFYFLGSDLNVWPLEVVPYGLGSALYDNMLYNPPSC